MRNPRKLFQNSKTLKHKIKVFIIKNKSIEVLLLHFIIRMGL